MPTPVLHAADLAALSWQIDLGATEAIGDAPINRYEAASQGTNPALAKAATLNASPTAAKNPAKNPAAFRSPESSSPENSDTVAAHSSASEALTEARRLATAATDLISLRHNLGLFDHCALKKGARNLVFADGNPVARVMIIGDAPSRDEDRAGMPFVGPAGQLLDKMLAAIDLSRQSDQSHSAVYITNVLPWRPPQSREPEPTEIAMMLPFLARHIALVSPDFLVPMGDIACQALLQKKGHTRLRGRWAEAFDLPVLPMLPPSYLLRNPIAKREAWADLLDLQLRLKG